MPHRVLVVDGAVEGLAEVQTHLQPHGFAFTWALTAQEAMETLPHTPPDVVIVDAGLTSSNPLELVVELKRAQRHLPIIVGLRRGDERQRALARRAGADDVLDRPFGPGLLAALAKQFVVLGAIREELDRKKRELEEVYRGQRLFVEGLVHDLKNPLAVVHVNLAWIRDSTSSDQGDVHEALGDCQEGVDQLQKMLDDLLMVGMLEEAALPLKRQEVAVGELLDQAVRAHQREAAYRRVSMRVSLDRDVTVIGDPVVLRRVVNNMVGSSLRHTPSSGSIELSARAGESVEIEISHTGQPLSSEEKADLLDKSPPSSRGRARGLGLYLCRRAVEAHSGVIDVVESGEGPTSVVMRLPSTGS